MSHVAMSNHPVIILSIDAAHLVQTLRELSIYAISGNMIHTMVIGDSEDPGVDAARDMAKIEAAMNSVFNQVNRKAQPPVRQVDKAWFRRFERRRRC